MLWTILALILLAAIAGLFWWRQKQEQKWRQELARLSGDEEEINEEESSVGFSSQLDSLKRLFSMNKRTADNHKIARIRLLSALEHNKMQRAETDEEHAAEPVAEEPEHIAATEEEIKVAPRTRKSAKPERIPKITPFAQMETPEYSPSLVQNSNFEEITLEEATRSLHEAAVEEWNEHLAEKNAPIYKDEVETPLLRASSLPMTGMEIIDYNDPILRRTRERALARANNVRVAEANAPHIETVQTALRTAEKEAILPYTSMQAFPSEIQAEDIHDNLARRTAARHKLAAASPLCATTLRAPSKMTKFWPTWDKSAVLPACAVKFAIPKRPPKDGRVNELPRKLLHHNLPHRQRRPVRNRLRLLKNPLISPDLPRQTQP